MSYTCWGQNFDSLEELSKDSRCPVCLDTVVARMRKGWGLVEAATVPPLLTNGVGTHVEVVCWGQVFPSIRDLSRDPRCEVSYCEVTRRLKRGLVAEEAVLRSTGPRKKPVRKKFRSE